MLEEHSSTVLRSQQELSPRLSQGCDTEMGTQMGGCWALGPAGGWRHWVRDATLAGGGGGGCPVKHTEEEVQHGFLELHPRGDQPNQLG